ncbi:hypothetical protein BD289DRAFT_351490, partial [Coniella lustricola]
YQPTKSSPLSSSPVRAPTSPPLTPGDANVRRATQSSPIPASSSSSSTPSFTSKFALRPNRPSPVTQKREAAQESRRKLFLKNVRQRAEDKRWDMRGGEQELLKLEWFSLNADLRQAKNSDLEGTILDSDIEDAAGSREEALRGYHPFSTTSTREDNHFHSADQLDVDDMMVDMFEHDQEQELEALILSLPDEQLMSNHRKPSGTPQWLDDDDDDDDYDALFMDYLSQQQTQ